MPYQAKLLAVVAWRANLNGAEHLGDLIAAHSGANNGTPLGRVRNWVDGEKNSGEPAVQVYEEGSQRWQEHPAIVGTSTGTVHFEQIQEPWRIQAKLDSSVGPHEGTHGGWAGVVHLIVLPNLPLVVIVRLASLMPLNFNSKGISPMLRGRDTLRIIYYSPRNASNGTTVARGINILSSRNKLVHSN